MARKPPGKLDANGCQPFLDKRMKPHALFEKLNKPVGTYMWQATLQPLLGCLCMMHDGKSCKPNETAVTHSKSCKGVHGDGQSCSQAHAHVRSL
eukprot:96320-Chlamydomonas_euryale.AAC.8